MDCKFFVDKHRQGAAYRKYEIKDGKKRKEIKKKIEKDNNNYLIIK